MFKPVNIGPLEQKVLSVIWQNQAKACTVSDVLNILNTEEEDLAYTTVMTILNRLVEKKYLSRNKNGRSFCYYPIEKKTSFLQQLIRSTINSFVTTFGEEAISTFAREASQLSSEHKKELKEKLQKN
jgi:predicted transcriptional regulator